MDEEKNQTHEDKKRLYDIEKLSSTSLVFCFYGLTDNLDY